MHRVQRCVLLLPMFRGLCVSECVCVCVCPLDITTTCAKTDEPIEIRPFGLCTRVGPRNRVFNGGPNSPRPGETGNFGASRAMRSFVKVLWTVVSTVFNGWCTDSEDHNQWCCDADRQQRRLANIARNCSDRRLPYHRTPLVVLDFLRQPSTREAPIA